MCEPRNDWKRWSPRERVVAVVLWLLLVGLPLPSGFKGPRPSINRPELSSELPALGACVTRHLAEPRPFRSLTPGFGYDLVPRCGWGGFHCRSPLRPRPVFCARLTAGRFGA